MGSNYPIKLKKTSEFDVLKFKGKKKRACPWLLISYRPNSQGKIRYGVTANKKTGPAVVRNKLKRWCREFIREEYRTGFNFEVDINFVFRANSNDFYKNLPFAEFKSVASKAFFDIRKNITMDS